MIIDLSNCVCHGDGCGARLYRFEDKIIKVPKFAYAGHLTDEFKIQKQLFDEGIRVAKPYDLVEVLNNFPDFELKQNRGILMEFIDGPTLYDLNEELRDFACRIYEDELSKCAGLGFKTIDTGSHNAIYHPENGVYLIDFELWSRK